MRNKVVLACKVCLSRNYTTRKNTLSQVTRLEMNKFCKKCGKHTTHHETK